MEIKIVKENDDECVWKRLGFIPTLPKIESKDFEPTTQQESEASEQNETTDEDLLPKVVPSVTPWKDFVESRDTEANVETLDANLFRKSYFIYNKIEEDELDKPKRGVFPMETKLVSLDPDLLKESSKIRSDPTSFMNEHSVVKNLTQRSFDAPVKKKRDTAGEGWYHMPAPKMTPDLELDLRTIQLRKNLFEREVLGEKPSKVTKKPEIPKYFQMGTLVEGNSEFYTRRKRKDKKASIVDEAMHDRGEFVEKEFKKVTKKMKRRKRDYILNNPKTKRRKRR